MDGKEISSLILKNLETDIKTKFAKATPPPGLATIQVGNRSDSSKYVKAKQTAAEKIGVNTSFSLELPETISEISLLKEIQSLNVNKQVDGILVQLPLPNHLNQEKILGSIAKEKDVDGFHPYNTGLLLKLGEDCRKQNVDVGSILFSNACFESKKKQEEAFFSISIPCTALGIITLLKHYDISVRKKHVVIIGRSGIVGFPSFVLMTHLNATCTLVHSKTVNLPQLTKQADVLICAAGVAELVKKEWIKENAIVVDVGINFKTNPILVYLWLWNGK